VTACAWILWPYNTILYLEITKPTQLHMWSPIYACIFICVILIQVLCMFYYCHFAIKHAHCYVAILWQQCLYKKCPEFSVHLLANDVLKVYTCLGQGYGEMLVGLKNPHKVVIAAMTCHCASSCMLFGLLCGCHMLHVSLLYLLTYSRYLSVADVLFLQDCVKFTRIVTVKLCV